MAEYVDRNIIKFMRRNLWLAPLFEREAAPRLQVTTTVARRYLITSNYLALHLVAPIYYCI